MPDARASADAEQNGGSSGLCDYRCPYCPDAHDYGSLEEWSEHLRQEHGVEGPL